MWGKFSAFHSFSRRISTTPPVHTQRRDDDKGMGGPAPGLRGETWLYVSFSLYVYIYI